MATIDNLTAWDTMEHFDKLCGFKNNYVPLYFDKENKPIPIHSFKDKDPATAFTRKELLRATAFGIRAGFNNIFILDTDYKKNDGASDIPERFRNTYTDETKGGKHYIYIIPQGIPSYWGLKRGEHGTPYGADLFPTKNNICIMTNSIRPNKYYRNITYMPPQPIPQELFNELDNYYKNNKKPNVESKENLIKVFNNKKQNVVKNFDKKFINYEKLDKMLNLLPIKYFNDGVLWNNMGWIIHYETNGSKEGYDLFVKYSRKPPKYKDTSEEVYIKFWNSANKTNSKQVTIATLIKYLHNEGYTQEDYLLKKDYLDKLITDVCSDETDLKIAKIGIFITKGDLYYYKEDDKILSWNKTHWKYEEASIKGKNANASVKKIIYEKVCNLIRQKKFKVLKILNNQINEQEREKTQSYLGKIKDLEIKLGRKFFIDSCSALLITILKNDYIVEKINLANDYFAFKNKIYDLKNDCFLKSTKEYKPLFNTLYCPYDYREPTKKESKTLNKIITQITYNDKEFLKEFLKFYSTALSGECLNKFVQLVGEGRNGKGLWNSLMLTLLGCDKFTGYSYSFDVKILCGKIKLGGSPELATLGNKRFVRTSEPSRSDGNLNNSFIKKLTGGDKINGRMLFGNKVEHNNNLSICLECNTEDQINIDGKAKDDATRERHIVMPMLSHFSNKGDKCKCKAKKYGRCFPKNKYYVDPNFQNQHVFALFKLLCTYWKLYKEDNKEIFLVNEMKKYTE